MTLETTTIQPFPAQRTALVTGAGAPRGIGRRVVRKLVSEGWNVAAADIDGAAVEEFAAELNAELPAESGLKVIGVGVDISDQDSVDAAFERVDAEMPQLVALVKLAVIRSEERRVGKEWRARGWRDEEKRARARRKADSRKS